MANPATVDDITARFFRPLTDRETEVAQAWLDDAWDILLDRRPNLENDIAAETVRESSVIRVLVAMVSRVFSNPEGKLSEQIDDYSYRRDSLVSSGALYISASELGDVSPGRRTRRSVRLVVYGDA